MVEKFRAHRATCKQSLSPPMLGCRNFIAASPIRVEILANTLFRQAPASALGSEDDIWHAPQPGCQQHGSGCIPANAKCCRRACACAKTRCASSIAGASIAIFLKQRGATLPFKRPRASVSAASPACGTKLHFDFRVLSHQHDFPFVSLATTPGQSPALRKNMRRRAAANCDQQFHCQQLLPG